MLPFARFFALASCLTMTSPRASATEPWTTEQITVQLAHTAVLGANWAQVSDIHRHPGLYATVGNTLGRQPEQSSINLFFAGSAVADALITNVLPSRYRRYWQCLAIGYHVGLVQRNYSIGLRIPL